MDMLSLGNGWYDLENIGDESFFWSSDIFSIYLETQLMELELYFNCNKTKSEYKLKYSTDGWITENVLNLESGLNVLNVTLNNKKRIDFSCDYFIPSKISTSSDDRKLGIQLIRALCKSSIDKKCYELDLRDFKFKSKLEFDKNNEEIDKDSFKITFGDGWHDLEEELFRWTNTRGVLYVKDDSITSIKLNLSSPSEQKLLVKNDLNRVYEFDLKSGNQDVFINDLINVKFLEIISNQHIVNSKENKSSDNRKLGIQLYSIDISNNNFDIRTLLTKNIFFEKDYTKLINFLNNHNNKNKLYNFNSDGHVRIGNFEDNGGKFNLNDQTVFYTHRSGWGYAIDSIKSLHSNTGIKFEGFLERTFSWEKYKNIRNNIIPLKNHWVGVIHNPMMTENNKLDLFSTTKLFNSIVFQKSLDTCKGIYVLSNDLKEKIRDKVGDIIVEFCYLPTKTPEKTFSLDLFNKNPDKKVVSLGSWARKFLTIFLLKTPSNFKKVMIEPPNLTTEKFKYLLDLEKSEISEKINFEKEVDILGYQSSDGYDNLLSENIMFMDFHDISASNLLVECIVRNTPILIKKHNSVVDYLGENYPFYFETLSEATFKINNSILIEETYDYLTKLKIKDCLSGDYFLNSVKNGKIYNSL